MNATPEASLDPRTIATIKWSTVWNAVAAAIEGTFAYVSLYFVGGFAGDFFRAFGRMPFGLPLEEILRQALWGAIIGAIVGFLLSKFYPQIQSINKNFLGGKLDTFFKLLFYPSVVGSLLGLVLTSGYSFGIGILPLLVITAGYILGSFVYAKMMAKYVGSLYHGA